MAQPIVNLSRPRSGADTLRLIVRNMGDARESFNDRFTAEELLQPNGSR